MSVITISIGATSASCGGDTSDDADGAGGGAIERPDTYAFNSRFVEGESSVSYSGQVARHLLIDRLKDRIKGLTARIDDGSLTPAEGDVVAELDFYYRFDSEVAGDLEHGKTTKPAADQATWNAVSSGKDLSGKIAGADPTGQHADWATELVGWTADGVTTPSTLVDAWFGAVEALAIGRANGAQGAAPGGDAIESADVSPEGLDYAELIQKFLLGAVAFSQGTDDYLDDSEPDKGLHEQNAEPDKEGTPYTSLEHAWDEAFGYFGAARNYGDYSADEAAGKGGRDGWATGQHDTDGDGAIDLAAELNWGHSVNAAKRDRGSAEGARTDFMSGAWLGFLDGRTLIANAGAQLTDTEQEALGLARDRAVANWELAISATVVHYINEVIGDMDAAGTDDYSFAGHAKHWSELKGFALGLQFSPRSPVTDAAFADLHRHLGQAPALPGADDFADRRQALLEARALLTAAYAFETANVEGW